MRILFITLLAMCDRDGYVYGSKVGLERLANITPNPDEASPWTTLMAPDPESSDLMRNPENEGRRIEEVPGGFRLLNFQYYRGLRNDDDRREQTRRAVAKYREKAKLSQGKPEKADDSHGNPISEAEAAQRQRQKEKKETDLEPRSPSAPVSVPSPGRTTIPQFHKPTVEQVRAYAAEMGYEDFDPLSFVAYYESVGWKRGKTPMKNWKAAVVTWMRRQ